MNLLTPYKELSNGKEEAAQTLQVAGTGVEC